MKSRTDIYGFDAQLKGMGKYIENLGTSRHNKAIIANGIIRITDVATIYERCGSSF